MIGTSRFQRSERFLIVALWLLTVTAILLAAGRILGRPWWPVFDDASIWLRTWDVGGRHTPLVGPHSRFGWHHPGPMLYYALAPVLRSFDGLPSALQLGALSIGLGSALGLVLLTARRVGPSAALVLALATGVLGLGYGDRLIEPWNPYVVTLPFALFMVAVWLVACGDAVAAPIAVLAGSFAGQSHLGAMPPVLLLGVVALLLDRLFPVSEARTSGARKWQAFAVALLVLLWLPPLVEQLSAPEGNLLRLFRFSVTPPEPTVGVKQGLLMTGAELLPWGPWLGYESRNLIGHLTPGSAWALMVSALPVLIALWLAVRFRDALGIRLAAIAASGFFACVLATAQIRGIPAEYLTLWSRAVAMLIVASPLVVLARRYATPLLGERIGAPVALAGASALALMPIALRARSAEFANPELSRAYEIINPLAVNFVPPKGRVRVVGGGIPFAASPHAIMVGLERAGRRGKSLPLLGPEVGEHRTIAEDAELPTLVLTMGADSEQLPDPAQARLVGRRDPVSPSRRAEAVELRGRLEQQLRDTHREDLIGALRNGATWLGPLVPTDLNRAELERYMELAGGEDKVPWTLFLLPPVHP